MDAVRVESLEPQEHSLRTLTIHEDEDETGICKRLVFSDYEIERLSKMLQNLEELSLDLNYEGKWPLETLSTISRSFPSLIHLGLNLEINVSHPKKSIYPAATLNSAIDIWNYVWKEMKAFRLTQPPLVPRSLEINAGSFRFGHESATTLDWARYERREQQTFQILRSEHDVEAEAGIASVKCTQVEELLAKYGTGPVSVSVQARLLEEARERAENGVMAEPDRRINRTMGCKSHPYNDFSMELEMDTVMPFFDDEELWLSKHT